MNKQTLCSLKTDKLFFSEKTNEFRHNNEMIVKMGGGGGGGGKTYLTMVKSFYKKTGSLIG